MNIRLCKMTRALCREYFQNFAFDPDIFMDPDGMKPYIYQPEKCDAIMDRYEQLGRIYMAVMLDEEPIGEVILKKIDHQKQCCTLGIHMKNDRYKNKGYGTQAEIMILEYAFDQCNMNVVYADAIHKNTRSQHVLEKVGFIETGRDESFVYYECRKDRWKPPTAQQTL